MVNGVEELFDVQVQNPVLLLATRPTHRDRIQRRTPRPITVESSWKIASVLASSVIATTVWAILSATVGTPNVRVPPPDFGMSTDLTGGGKYDPADIRFQILYRLFFRSFSKASTDTPSTPAAPLLAAIRLYASQTSCFEISNDLVVWPDMPTRLLPENLSGCSGEHLVDDPAPSLPAHYRRFTATTDRSASRCHDGTQHLPVLAG
jgi:hypothetical protein